MISDTANILLPPPRSTTGLSLTLRYESRVRSLRRGDGDGRRYCHWCALFLPHQLRQLLTSNIAYTTFQPELHRREAEKRGQFHDQHSQPDANDKVISQAIINDLREAKQQVALDTTSSSGPAWKLRQMIFGKKTSTPEVGGLSTVVPDARQVGEKERNSG